MIVGIDASNIRTGGGLHYLLALLKKAKPEKYGLTQVVVWAKVSVLDRIEDRPWLLKVQCSMLEKGGVKRFFWQKYKLKKIINTAECNVLFTPGGRHSRQRCPVVTMSQNMLPFELKELRRFGLSWATLRLLILRYLQLRSFRKADGLIFLTNYVQKKIKKMLYSIHASDRIISHGIEPRFFCPPRLQREIETYTENKPLRIMYVSIINVYKHHRRVVEAVARLRDEGFFIVLDLIGPAYPPSLARLNKILNQTDLRYSFVNYMGTVPYDDIHRYYREADLFVFASSCESMPNVLLEAMGAGLPIACSKSGPMPEILKKAGEYFDPEDSIEVANALRKLIISPSLRFDLAEQSFKLAEKYSWEKCAEETFSFLKEVAQLKV